MRLAAIIALLFSFLVLAKGALHSWEKIQIPAMVDSGAKMRAGAGAERQPLALNPQVPPLLPDLRQGYLFNEQRQLAEDSGEEGKNADESQELASTQVNLDTLNYTGSLIVGNTRKGLVSFSILQPEQSERSPGRIRSISREQKSNTETAIVSENEEFYDLRVASIQPDKIVFTKSGSTIEKMLYAPDKKRVAPPPQAQEKIQPAGKAPIRLPQSGRMVRAGQPVEQPAAVQPDFENINPNQATPPARTVRPPALPTRSIQRPQVIQRRRLPVQSK